MKIHLYKNRSEKNQIGKRLTGEIELTGDLRNETSIIDPVILVEAANISDYNYMKIPLFNRYYFINDITSVRTGLWLCKCHVDVLESFETDIKNLTVILSDTEKRGKNNYLMGEQWKSKVKTTTHIKNFPSGLNEEGEFILITAGGGN